MCVPVEGEARLWYLTPMENGSYDRLVGWVEKQGIKQHPSEVHGLITGLVCAGTQMDTGARLGALSECLTTDLESSAGPVLDKIFDEAVEGLADEEFGFRIMVPDDRTAVSARTEAVSAWCSGFLAGFGLSGRYRDEELSEDLKEVFADLGRIAAFSDDVPEDDDNEADLLEIGEYVRMSALLVFTECANKQLH
jgi:uncharacterized protein YgfB (UPF0149 family)